MVKLLARMYEPSSGTIAVDDVPLDGMTAGSWRAQVSGAFQDFYRFELPARHSIGVGDLPRMDDERAVVTAVDRAGAADVIAKLPSGLDTQLGVAWPGGVDVSVGQWQKLALARGFMRDDPLLLILVERYAALAKSSSNRGRVTLLVSHRFSTVRMADLIVVLDGARVVETGTHDELLAQGGQYAQLYRIQQSAYR
jgi:ATP-binding cassette subfamily B protein